MLAAARRGPEEPPGLFFRGVIRWDDPYIGGSVSEGL